MDNMQKDVNYAAVWGFVACALLIIGIIGGGMYLHGISVAAANANAKVDAIKVPTASEIASQITIPAADNSGGSASSQLCELTNGCNGFVMSDSNANIVANKLSANGYRELKKAIKSSTGLDTDEYNWLSVQEKDRYVLAVSEKEANKGNYNVEFFYRIQYLPVDGNWMTDSQIIYVSVTASVSDGIDVNNITSVKVDRNYEISEKPI